MYERLSRLICVQILQATIIRFPFYGTGGLFNRLEIYGHLYGYAKLMLEIGGELKGRFVSLVVLRFHLHSFSRFVSGRKEEKFKVCGQRLNMGGLNVCVTRARLRRDHLEHKST